MGTTLPLLRRIVRSGAGPAGLRDLIVQARRLQDAAEMGARQTLVGQHFAAFRDAADRFIAARPEFGPAFEPLTSLGRERRPTPHVVQALGDWFSALSVVLERQGARRPPPPPADAGVSASSVFLMADGPAGFATPDVIRVRQNGTPSAVWGLIVERANQGGAWLHFQTVRQNPSEAIFIPGRSTLADLMQLVVSAGDLVQVRYRHEITTRGEEAVTGLRELVARILKGELSPWEAVEEKLLSVANLRAAGPLETRRVVDLAKELRRYPDARLLLENQTRSGRGSKQALIACNQHEDQIRAALSSFVASAGETLSVTVISRSPLYPLNSVAAAYQGEALSEGDLQGRSLAFAVSKPGEDIFPLELADRIARKETEPLVALVRLDTHQILTYQAAAALSASEMAHLWRSTEGNKDSPIATASVELADRRVRMSLGGELNQNLGAEALLFARDLLLQQLIARRAGFEIVAPDDFSGPLGHVFRFDLRGVNPDLPPLPPREISEKLAEALAAGRHHVEPVIQPARTASTQRGTSPWGGSTLSMGPVKVQAPLQTQVMAAVTQELAPLAARASKSIQYRTSSLLGRVLREWEKQFGEGRVVEAFFHVPTGELLLGRIANGGGRYLPITRLEWPTLLRNDPRLRAYHPADTLFCRIDRDEGKAIRVRLYTRPIGGRYNIRQDPEIRAMRDFLSAQTGLKFRPARRRGPQKDIVVFLQEGEGILSRARRRAAGLFG